MITEWLQRYKSAVGGRATEQPKPDALLNQTYLKLFQAQREHYFIDVTVEGDDVVYQSMILSLDPEEKTLLIDELFPRGFVGLPGQKVRVNVRQPQGRKIKFSSEIMEQHIHDDTPLYVLAMPETLDSDQRRNAYRLPVGRALSVQPHFIGPDNRNYLARLRDVSSRGVAMEVELDDPERFRFDDSLSHVEFDFAGISFDCDMTIRNLSFDDRHNKVLIGAEFVDLPPLEQHTLEKSIMRIQRDRIRMGADMETQLATA